MNEVIGLVLSIPVVRPVLLIPFFFLMLAFAWFFSFAWGFILYFILSITSAGNINFALFDSLLYVLATLTFALFILGYLGILVESLFKSLKPDDPSKRVLLICEYFVAFIFSFSVIHYYVALFSNKIAYAGLSPIEINSYDEFGPVIEKLLTVPNFETIIDLIYFTTVTFATVGYGEIHPSSIIAKTATTLQIVFGFGLVAVALGRSLNRQ